MFISYAPPTTASLFWFYYSRRYEFRLQTEFTHFGMPSVSAILLILSIMPRVGPPPPSPYPYKNAEVEARPLSLRLDSE